MTVVLPIGRVGRLVWKGARRYHRMSTTSCSTSIGNAVRIIGLQYTYVALNLSPTFFVRCYLALCQAPLIWRFSVVFNSRSALACAA